MASPLFALGSTRVVTPDGERPGVVRIAGERILDVVAPHEAPPGWEDLGDLVIMPGLVDSHVHVNDPGRAHWEGFETATRAAAVGGITTVVDMPLNCLPPTTTHSALVRKLVATEGRLHVDVALWGGVVPGSEEHLEELHAAGVLGFKAFLCDSGVPEYGSFSPTSVARLLERTVALDVPLIVHAEHPAGLLSPAPGADPRAYQTWLTTRPDQAEVDAIAALLDGVRATGGRLHVLHLSAGSALELLSRARQEGLPVTVETCPHYLTIAADDIVDGATEFKCAPPIRERANQDQLWAGLAAGVIDSIVSDHSPAPPAAKHLESGDFLAAWGGIASLQLGLSVVWTAARSRGFDLSDVVRWMAAGPAMTAGLARKGSIAPGADADLVVFDPDSIRRVDRGLLEHRHPVTPYHGREVRGAVKRTYLRGRCVVIDGKLRMPATGQPRRRGEL